VKPGKRGSTDVNKEKLMKEDKPVGRCVIIKSKNVQKEQGRRENEVKRVCSKNELERGRATRGGRSRP